MKKTTVVGWLYLCLFTGTSCAQDIPQIAIAAVKMRYAEMTAMRAIPDGNGMFSYDDNPANLAGGGSGCRIGGKYVVVNFHELYADHFFRFGDQKAKFLNASPEADLALLEVDIPGKVSWAKLADPVQGEMLYSLSNGGMNSGSLRRYFVSSFDQNHIILQDQFIPGDSGACLINKNGELVGIALENRNITEGGVYAGSYGKAIVANIILKNFLRTALPKFFAEKDR